jgi:3-dehydroquinate synthase
MLTIQSRSHPYDVEAVDSLQSALAQSARDEKSFFLVDARVAELYPPAFLPVGEGRLLRLEATEEQKSYERLTPVFMSLLESGFRRDWTLVVIGGGILQDIGGFVASVLFRSVAWELIPTTLLAQCDSCVGSKSSLNIGPYKNQLGTFHPPRRIRIPGDVLKTLRPDDIRSGIGEMLKLALIAGEAPFEKLKSQLRRCESDPAVMREMILDSLSFKKGYVEKDEFDKGIRNLLNYGHTFGHAYESASHFGIPHGIAVTLGVLTAAYFSERLGMLPAKDLEAWDAVLQGYYRPYHRQLTGAALEPILTAMRHDKKNTNGKIHCILTRGYGRMERVPLDADRQVRPLMTDFLGWLAGRPGA